ncbi:MAG: acetyl-CoA carboxylase biotin carboxyl carrier protein subunit [Flavobacteriales bacterium]|nr:acetyl-CoA carboxylase biotin carboxyl carrier protein subunit [Flavobacteriales bacterium]
MLFVKSENKNYEINIDDALVEGTVNGESIVLDYLKKGKSTFSTIYKERTYTIHVVSFDKKEKKVTLSVNGNEYIFQLETKHDRLLKEMGMADSMTTKITDVKAPMPGLVLDIKVAVAQEVNKGDALLVLEAMKMENILKSPVDGTIKDIQVKSGTAVEKNEVLINFE